MTVHLPDLPIPSQDRTRKVSHVLPYLSALLMVLVLGFCIALLWGQGTTNTSLSAQHRTDDVSACRGEYRAAIDTANIAESDAESQRIDAISDILLASIRKDRPAVLAASKRLASSKAAVNRARHLVRLATSANLAA